MLITNISNKRFEIRTRRNRKKEVITKSKSIRKRKRTKISRIRSTTNRLRPITQELRFNRIIKRKERNRCINKWL